jgi:hypothetical protein
LIISTHIEVIIVTFDCLTIQKLINAFYGDSGYSQGMKTE